MGSTATKSWRKAARTGSEAETTLVVAPPVEAGGDEVPPKMIDVATVVRVIEMFSDMLGVRALEFSETLDVADVACLIDNEGDDVDKVEAFVALVPVANRLCARLGAKNPDRTVVRFAKSEESLDEIKSLCRNLSPTLCEDIRDMLRSHVHFPTGDALSAAVRKREGGGA